MRPDDSPAPSSSRSCVVWSWDRRDPDQLVTLLAVAGVMDPLCGGTRATRYTAQGEWALAWKYNPLGILTVIGAAGLTIRAVIGLSARRWLTVHVTWTPRRRRVSITILVALLVVLEVRQQLRAEMLIAGS